MTLDATARGPAREGEAPFRALADNIPQLAWMARPDGHIFWFNRRWFDFTGTTLAQMDGWGWRSVHHPDHLDRVVKRFRDCIETGTPWEDSFPLRGADGTYRWFLSRAEPVRDATGHTAMWFGTNTDVTEAREADERRAFLLNLTEALRDLSDPVAMMETATALLGRRLGVAQVGFGEVDDASGTLTVHRDWNDGRIPSVIGSWQMDHFGPEFIQAMRRGETVAIADIREDPRTNAPRVMAAYNGISTRAILDVPLLREGRQVAMLFTHHPGPRAWTRDEMELVEETCRRLWPAVERARAETGLRESEARWRLFVDRAPAGIAMFDTQMRYIAASRRFLLDYGLDAAGPEALIGRSHYDVIPEIPERWREIHRRVLSGETLSAEEEPFSRADGHTDWVRWEMTPWRRADGSTGGAVLFSEVVTDRVATQARLRESEARLRFVLESSPDNIFIQDRELRYVWMTRPVEPLPPEAYVGKTDDELTDLPGEGERLSAIKRRVMAEGRGTALEVPMLLMGKQRVFDATYEPWRDALGEVAGVLGYVRDVTERRRAEAALREGETRMRLALEAGNGGAWDWNLETGELRCDATLERLCGIAIPPGPDAAAAFAARVHPDDAPAKDQALREAVAQGVGAAYRAEFRFRHGDGGWRWLTGPARVLAGPDGRPTRVTGIDFDVTEQKAAEARRLVEEARAGLALRAGGLIAWEIQAGTGRLVAADELATLYGVGEAERDGTMAPFAARIHPEDRARVLAEFAAAARPGGTYRSEFRILHPCGERWLLGVGEGVAQPDGSVHVVGYNADITAQKHASAALAESERRLRLATGAGGLAVWELEAATGALTHDEGLAVMFGLTRAAQDGTAAPFLALIHPADQDRVAIALGKVTAPGGIFQAEYRIHRANDGAMRWVQSFGEAQRDARGRLRIFGYCRDVTERRQADAALAESEARFRALVDSMPQLAFTVLPNGQDDFLNRRWYEYTGQAPGSGEGRGWEEVVHPEDLERTRAAWTEVLATGGEYMLECRLRGADGIHRWFLVRAYPFHGVGGRILKWFGTCTDISQIVAARDAVARQSEELERRVAERTRALSVTARELAAEMRRREETQAALLQSQKLEALGHLTSSITHDFNNLLAAVLGSYRLLERRIGEDPKAAVLISHGRHAAERGARLITGLMAFVRKEELRPALVEPLALLREGEELFRHTAGSRVSCRFELAPDAWPVIADAARLETVLLNLAANARDAMPDGGELVLSARNAQPGEVPPELPAGRDWLLISVVDTGQGMDAATLAQAKEPFFTTKAPGKGTGIGLASANAFAQQSGGALRLRSQPGQGATVELFLPRAKDIVARDAAPDSARHGGARIMLVDDDEGVRSVTAALLVELGYEVLDAPSAEAAEALARAEAKGGIDMLVTDVVMDGAAGPVLAARLRAERPSLPVLYITGNPGWHDLGQVPVLTKPFTEAALAEAVLRGLGRRPG